MVVHGVASAAKSVDAPLSDGDDSPSNALLRRGDERPVAGIAALVVAVCSALVVVAHNRGIDTTDGSFYLTMVDKPDASTRSATGFHHLLHPLFVAAGESVPAWKLVRAFFDIGSDAFLGVALVTYIRRRYPSSFLAEKTPTVAAVLVVVAMGFTSYAWAPNGFGYNELGSIVFTTIGGLLLLLVSDSERGRPGVALALGAVLVFAFITRWTGGVASSVLVAATIGVTYGHRKALAIARFVAVGAALAAAVVHTLVLDLPTLVSGISNGTSDSSDDSHATSKLLATYVRATFDGVVAAPGFVVAVVVALGVVHFGRSGRIRSRAAVAALVASAALIEFVIDRAWGSRPSANNSWGVVLFILCAVLLIGQVKRRRASGEGVLPRGEVALAIALLLLPLGAVVGTNVWLFMSTMFLSSIWAALAILLLRRVRPYDVAGVAIGVSIFTLMAIVPVLTYESLFVQPFGMVGEQSIRVERGRFTGLKVDSVTHAFVHDLEDLRQTLEPGPTVISLWARPVVPFALDGHGIGFAFYSEQDGEISATTIRESCVEDGVDPTSGELVVVLESDDWLSDHPSMSEAFKKCGIGFPQDFEQVDTLLAPGNTPVDVYVHHGDFEEQR